MKAHPKTGRTIREEAESLAARLSQASLPIGHLESADLIEHAIMRYAAPRYTKNGRPKTIKEACGRCMGSGSKNDAISCGDCGGKGFIERAKDEPDYRVKAFIDWFCSVYEAHQHTPYVPSWARDGADVKRLLKSVSPNVLQDCATILLDERTQHKFIEESDRGIAVLAVTFNWLAGRRAALIEREKGRVDC